MCTCQKQRLQLKIQALLLVETVEALDRICACRDSIHLRIACRFRIRYSKILYTLFYSRRLNHGASSIISDPEQGLQQDYYKH